MNWSVLPKCVVVLPEHHKHCRSFSVSLSVWCAPTFFLQLWGLHHLHWDENHPDLNSPLPLEYVPWQKFLSEHVHAKSTKWCQGAWYSGMGDNRQSNMFMKMSADCRGRSDHLAPDFNHMWDHLDRSSYFCLQAKLQDKDWGLKQEWRDSIWSKTGKLCWHIESLKLLNMSSWHDIHLEGSKCSENKSRDLVCVSWVLRICTPLKFNMDTKPIFKTCQNSR